MTSAAGKRRGVGRVTGGVAPAEMSVATSGACARATSTYRRATTTTGYYLGKQTRSLRRHERRPSYTHAAAPVLGPRAVTPGVAANPGPSANVSSTCLLLRAMQRRRVESLVLGALSSSPVHRTLVLVSGTNIAVLLCC